MVAQEEEAKLDTDRGQLQVDRAGVLAVGERTVVVAAQNMFAAEAAVRVAVVALAEVNNRLDS